MGEQVVAKEQALPLREMRLDHVDVMRARAFDVRLMNQA